MKKAKIISVINYKGGVGKTVTSFNLAAGLNFLNGHSVLLIDLDPQCSLSTICMKAYSRTYGNEDKYKFSQLQEDECINHVFRTALNQDILDFELSIDLDRLIKRDFYKSERLHLKGFDFIPATMLVGSSQGLITGLEDIDGDIRQSYGNSTNSQLMRLSILAKFFKKSKLDEQYDFIIFDCPPTNNHVTQNALFVSDYYLVPTIMDHMGQQGVHHIKNIIEKKEILEFCQTYETLIRLAPESSYLSYLKTGVPKMLGIVETLKKARTDTKQIRSTIELNCPNQLFHSVIEHQVNISRLAGEGECCFVKPEVLAKVKPNQMYANLVFEVLERLQIEKSKYARKATDYL